MISADDVLKIISRAIKPLQRKILLSIAHGIIEESKDDGPLQFIQATFLEGETKNNVRKMHHFGFTSSAPPGSECIGVSVAGNREAVVVIATENREFRFKNLGNGETAIYSKDGDYIHLKGGNVIDIKTKTLNIEAETSVNIVSPTVNITGNSVVTGSSTSNSIISTTTVVAASVAAPSVAAATSLVVAGQELSGFAAHTHDYLDNDGTVDTPRTTGGVNP